MKLQLNSNLSQKAMLATLRMSALQATKYDKQASDEVTDTHQADRDAVRVYKRLIKKEDLAEINAILNQAHTEFHRATLPWGDKGTRICPAAKYFELSQKINALKTELKTVAVPNFLPRYTAIIQEALRTLGTLGKPEDFIPAAELPNRWTIEIRFLPLPNVNDWRVEIGDEELARAKTEAAEEITRTIRDTVASLYARLIGSVQSCKGLAYVVHTLGTKDKIFRDSLIENIADLCQIARELNITGDPDLEAMVTKVEIQIASLNPKDIREDETLREDAAKRAQQIVDQMSAFMTAHNNE